MKIVVYVNSERYEVHQPCGGYLDFHPADLARICGQLRPRPVGQCSREDLRLERAIGGILAPDPSFVVRGVHGSEWTAMVRSDGRVELV